MLQLAKFLYIQHKSNSELYQNSINAVNSSGQHEATYINVKNNIYKLVQILYWIYKAVI